MITFTFLLCVCWPAMTTDNMKATPNESSDFQKLSNDMWFKRLSFRLDFMRGNWKLVRRIFSAVFDTRSIIPSSHINNVRNEHSSWERAWWHMIMMTHDDTWSFLWLDQIKIREPRIKHVKHARILQPHRLPGRGQDQTSLQPAQSERNTASFPKPTLDKPHLAGLKRRRPKQQPRQHKHHQTAKRLLDYITRYHHAFTSITKLNRGSHESFSRAR